MPVTRGKARLIGSQEEEIELQQLPEMQEEHDMEEHQTSTEMEAPEVDLKAMAKQLTDTLKHLLTTHRQLEKDAATIQEGMDELHCMQETASWLIGQFQRAKRIVKRLKNASSTILTFGDENSGKHSRHEDNNNDEMSAN
ncbi:hypothetical protein CCR75_000520 [Bremia lactucae]|uniref:Uncharacterized protein n=1 Tax=Bremia lactucae TaxID=4779 RepID=A0A976IJZ9_BRELC|nr:hypothetical protein CCR75_000520 [Bremia lactucae]